MEAEGRVSVEPEDPPPVLKEKPRRRPSLQEAFQMSETLADAELYASLEVADDRALRRTKTDSFGMSEDESILESCRSLRFMAWTLVCCLGVGAVVTQLWCDGPTYQRLFHVPSIDGDGTYSAYNAYSSYSSYSSSYSSTYGDRRRLAGGGSVFGAKIGVEIHAKEAAWVFAATIFFLVCLDMTWHTLEHEARKAESHGRSDVYVQIVHKVTQELAILGLISFGLFMYLQLEIDIEDHYLLTFGWYHTHSFVEL